MRAVCLVRVCCFLSSCIVIKAVIAPGFHLFPFRTEQLSPCAPMVLRDSGRVGRRRFPDGSLPRVMSGEGILVLDVSVCLSVRNRLVY